MRRLIGVIGLVLCAATAAFAQSGTAQVTADQTSVRDRAATDGTVVATVRKGDELTVLAANGSWLRVRTKAGAEGFVHALFVSQTAGQAPGSSSSAAAVPASAPAAQPSAAMAPQSQPSTGTGGNSPVVDDRKFGLGLGGGGLSWGFVPSARYWFSDKVGAETSVAFYSSGYLGASYHHTAISPSAAAPAAQAGNSATRRAAMTAMAMPRV